MAVRVQWEEMAHSEAQASGYSTRPMLPPAVAMGRMERLDRQIATYLAAGDEARLRRVRELRERLAAIEQEADEVLDDVPSDAGAAPQSKELLSFLTPDDRRLVSLWDGEIGARLALAGSAYAPEAEWLVWTSTFHSEAVEDLRGAALRGDLNFGDPRIAAKIAEWLPTDSQPAPNEQSVEWKLKIVLPVTEDDLVRMINTELKRVQASSSYVYEAYILVDQDDEKAVADFDRKMAEIYERTAQQLAENPLRLFNDVHWLQPDFQPWFNRYTKKKEAFVYDLVKDTVVGTPGQVDPLTKRVALFDLQTFKALTGDRSISPVLGVWTPVNYRYLASMSYDYNATTETFDKSPPMVYNAFPTSPKFYVKGSDDDSDPRIKLQFTTIADPKTEFLKNVLPFFVRAYVNRLATQKFIARQ